MRHNDSVALLLLIAFSNIASFHLTTYEFVIKKYKIETRRFAPRIPVSVLLFCIIRRAVHNVVLSLRTSKFLIPFLYCLMAFFCGMILVMLILIKIRFVRSNRMVTVV